MKLKIYSDRAEVSAGTLHAFILTPFWGKSPEDPNEPDAGRFDEYAAVGGRFLELTTLEVADVAIFPLDWSSVGGDAEMAAAHRFIESAQAAGKPSIVFFNSDSAEQLPVEPTAVVRWRDYCVWVDDAELDRAGEIVAEFHEQLTDKEFEELQQSCRRFWEEYIRPVAFFSNFHRIATTLGEPVAL